MPVTGDIHNNNNNIKLEYLLGYIRTFNNNNNNNNNNNININLEYLFGYIRTFDGYQFLSEMMIILH